MLKNNKTFKVCDNQDGQNVKSADNKTCLSINFYRKTQPRKSVFEPGQKFHHNKSSNQEKTLRPKKS